MVRTGEGVELRGGPDHRVSRLFHPAGRSGSSAAGGPKRPRAPNAPEDGPPVRIDRAANVLRIVLTRPAKRNALSAAMRDALCDALGLVALDSSIERAELSGEGENFCAGGDFQEFGAASDLASAHVLRLTASAALAAHRARERLSVPRPRRHRRRRTGNRRGGRRLPRDAPERECGCRKSPWA